MNVREVSSRFELCVCVQRVPVESFQNLSILLMFAVQLLTDINSSESYCLCHNDFVN